MRKSRYRGIKTLMVEGPAGVDALREAPAASQDNLDYAEQSDCAAFLDLWRGLRQDHAVPVITRFCEALTGAFAAACSIAELHDNAAIVRFQGAGLIERWGQDLTGRDLYGTFPYYARTRALANIGQVCAHPCGYFGANRVAVPDKGLVASHFIQLPLASDDSAPSYVAHFSVVGPPPPATRSNAHYYESRNTGWIDLGAGVPARRPYLLDAPRAAAG